MNNFLDSIEEQNRVKIELNKICERRRAPHAFIFSGLEGTGKFYTAIQFAKELSKVANPNISESSLKNINELCEPQIKLILPLPRGKGEGLEDSGFEKLDRDTVEEIQAEIKKKIANPYHKIKIENANTIKISSIREIKKYLSLSESSSQLRFIIIDQAHLLNDQSQNALLKSLEEPPENVHFILITNKHDNLLPTIISRCRVIRFNPFSAETIEKILHKNFFIEARVAKEISRFAEGSVLHAVELLSHDFYKIQEKAITLLRYSFGRKYQAAIAELSEFTDSNSQNTVWILLQLIRFWILDALKNRKELLGYSFEKHRETFEKFNQKFNDANLISPFIFLEKLESLIESRINLNVLFLNIVFELNSVVKRK